MSNRRDSASGKKGIRTRQLQPPSSATSEVGLERKFVDSTTPMQLSTEARAPQSDRIGTSGASLKRKLLNIEELEQIYGLKHWTIRTWCSQRRIPHLKIGRRVYFDPAAIESWIQEHARPAEEAHIA
jgi:predicted DNA-binding transcriptional regulator AlpA